MNHQRTILTYSEIAERTGIKVTALRKRLCTGTMPKPDLRVGGSPVWFPETLETWLTTAAPNARPQNRRENRNASV